MRGLSYREIPRVLGARNQRRRPDTCFFITSQMHSPSGDGSHCTRLSSRRGRQAAPSARRAMRVVCCLGGRAGVWALPGSRHKSGVSLMETLCFETLVVRPDGPLTWRVVRPPALGVLRARAAGLRSWSPGKLTARGFPSVQTGAAHPNVVVTQSRHAVPSCRPCKV